jgi:RecB family exonuclease
MPNPEAAAKRHAWVSHASRDDGGRPWTASVFVDGLARLGAASLACATRPSAPLSRAELGALALQQARIGLFGAESPAWRDLASQVLSPATYDSVQWRARVEVARGCFFQNERSALETWRQAAGPELPSDLTGYLGYITHPEVRAWLMIDAFRFGPEKPASASQLAHYGCCPMQFFLSDVLQLRPDEEAEEELKPTTRGTIFHDALNRLCDKLVDRNITSLEGFGGPGPGRDLLLQLLGESFEEAAARADERDHLGHPGLWAAARRRMIDRALKGINHALNPKTRKDNRLPLAVPPAEQREWSFGGWGRPPVALDLGAPWGPIHVRGRIDRIDDGEQGLVVTDYKYGVKQKDWQLNRTDFQLPIYAAAVALSRARLGTQIPMEVKYFHFGKPGALTLTWSELRRVLDGLIPDLPALAPEAAVDDAAEKPPTLREALRDTLDGIRSGRYPAATRSCTYCGWPDLCRVSPRLAESEE